MGFAKSKRPVLAISSEAVDPTLADLFSSSSGPAKAPSNKFRHQRSAASAAVNDASDPDLNEEADSAEDVTAESLELEAEYDSANDSEQSTSAGEAEAGSSDVRSDGKEQLGHRLEATAQSLHNGVDSGHANRKRKRHPSDDNSDMEAQYLGKHAGNPALGGKVPWRSGMDAKPDSDDEDEDKVEDNNADGDAMVHESLAKDRNEEMEKASRTVFLSNVSIDALTSRAAKKALLSHLSSALDRALSPPQKVESLRFRSVPFSSASMPKRAAYITKALMDATTKSTNAYAVYSTASAARSAVAKLNGTVVLDRHLRVDSVAHPSPVDHRRCVFVGNLGFVDDETIIDTKVNEDGKEEMEKRKRTKAPMDVEEGLWRTFGKHAGKVESVRVVRDQVTRVGKGIAYVQFEDANSVEAALLLAGKKFPPLLPRSLRVSRCKAPHKTARAMERSQASKKVATAPGPLSDSAASGKKYTPKPTAGDQTLAGRAPKLLGRVAASRNYNTGGRSQGRQQGGKGSISERPSSQETKFKSPEAVVFEGWRASAKDDRRKRSKTKGNRVDKRESVNTKKRQTQRSAKWREKLAVENPKSQ